MFCRSRQFRSVVDQATEETEHCKETLFFEGKSDRKYTFRASPKSDLHHIDFHFDRHTFSASTNNLEPFLEESVQSHNCQLRLERLLVGSSIVGFGS
ncbi:hypothetical protein L6164_015810 [Bauhinia variegata]|uniref:Uncharacterized protein n=1 Tax=Bauhinia variegata TaxID=167791 RepID=A0ACB9NN04_BAUVA|nr:hypothetical protein L6164_015810 [Bauhinia variegata]